MPNELISDAARDLTRGVADDRIAHWGARLALAPLKAISARLGAHVLGYAIPFAGEALIAYDAISLADTGLNASFKFMTGTEWRDTPVGRTTGAALDSVNTVINPVYDAVDTVAVKAGTFVASSAGGLLKVCGFPAASAAVASWGDWFVGDTGAPVAPGAVSRNPVIVAGGSRLATPPDLPFAQASSPTPADLARISAFAEGRSTPGPTVSAASLADAIGSPAARTNRDEAAVDRARLADYAPKTPAPSYLVANPLARRVPQAPQNGKTEGLSR